MSYNNGEEILSLGDELRATWQVIASFGQRISAYRSAIAQHDRLVMFRGGTAAERGGMDAVYRVMGRGAVLATRLTEDLFHAFSTGVVLDVEQRATHIREGRPEPADSDVVSDDAGE